MRRPYQKYLRPYQPPPKRDRAAYLLWLSSLGVLMASTEDLLSNHTAMLVNGSLTPSQWGASVFATLSHAHPMAYVIGANSLGGEVTPTEAQILLGQTMRDQAEFLSEFIEDLEEGDPRYRKTLEELYPELGTEEEIKTRLLEDDKILPAKVEDFEGEFWDEKEINRRLFLYNERIRGTANWAAVDMLSPTEEIYWRDDPSPSECDECKGRARVTWFKGTLPGVPGDGSTPCMVHCRCHLELADGTVIQF